VLIYVWRLYEPCGLGRVVGGDSVRLQLPLITVYVIYLTEASASAVPNTGCSLEAAQDAAGLRNT
jgi:hypothetical protein